jgi:hypothetical protein
MGFRVLHDFPIVQTKTAPPRFGHAPLCSQLNGFGKGRASGDGDGATCRSQGSPPLKLGVSESQEWERQHHVRNTVRTRPPLHRSGPDLVRSRLVARQDTRTRPVGRTRRWTRSTGAAGSTASRDGGARASPTLRAQSGSGRGPAWLFGCGGVRCKCRHIRRASASVGSGRTRRRVVLRVSCMRAVLGCQLQ